MDNEYIRNAVMSPGEIAPAIGEFTVVSGRRSGEVAGLVVEREGFEGVVHPACGETEDLWVANFDAEASPP